MTMTDLATVVAAQLMDPFRIALILGLIYTAQRNAAVTGSDSPSNSSNSTA